MFPVKFRILLVDGVFLLLEPVFGFSELIVLFVDVLLVLALELQELFLCLENLFLPDVFGFYLSLLDDFILPALQQLSVDEYICPDGNDGSDGRR